MTTRRANRSWVDAFGLCLRIVAVALTRSLSADAPHTDDFAAPTCIRSRHPEELDAPETICRWPLWPRALTVGTAYAQTKGGKAGKDMEFEPESAASTPPSKTLERAIKLYDKKDFFSASIELKKVLDGESGDDAKNKQRAEFFMGKTLYQMGFYAGSLAYFDKIVQAGDNHTYHGAALKWLAALSPRAARDVGHPREDRYLRSERAQ